MHWVLALDVNPSFSQKAYNGGYGMTDDEPAR